jgi:protein phosphatase 1 regulatory subunit 7
LEELYVSDNGIEVIGGLDHVMNLQTLDIANNKLKTLVNLKHLPKLQEFWVSGQGEKKTGLR